MTIDRRWALVELLLILMFAIGFALKYAFAWLGAIHLLATSMLIVVGAHALLARIVLASLRPKTSRRQLVSTLFHFAVFSLGMIYLYGQAQAFMGIVNTVSGKITNNWIDGIYFSAITWTTVGYGDFIPSGVASRYLAAFEALDAYLVMVLFVSCLIPLVTREARYYQLRERATWRRYLALKRAEETERKQSNTSPKGPPDSSDPIQRHDVQG